MRVLYCIVADPDKKVAAELSEVTGIDGKPLESVSCSSLTAVTSRIPKENPQTDIKTLLAYQEVIDFFFNRHTLVPMRFDSVINSSQQLVEHLEEKAEYYTKLLSELADCAEMGIRVLKTSNDSTMATVKNDTKTNEIKSGRDFLAARKAYYESRDQMNADGRQVAAELQKIFSGFYKKSMVESDQTKAAGVAPGKRVDYLASLYFLVPRKNLEKFRDLFQQQYGNKSDFLLSGPWPPYNFVTLQSE